MQSLTRTQLTELASKADFVGFGAGEFGEKTLGLLPGRFSYFVDNHYENFTNPWLGIEVAPPCKLAKEPHTTVVIICSEHYVAIERQIKAINSNLHCFLSPLLKDYELQRGIIECSQALLVSSYHVSGGLYLVNPRDRHVQLLVQGSFRGIAQANARLFACDSFGSVWEILQMNPFSTRCIFRPSEHCDAHGLTYWPKEDSLLMIQTRFDRIVKISLSTLESQQLFSGPRAATGSDRHHLNDLCLVEDTLFFSLFSPSGWWRQGILDGSICALDLRSQRVSTVMQGLAHPHSVRFIDGQLVVLDSSRGQILSGSNQRLATLPGFLRGLWGGNSIAYVGQSRHRRLELCRDSDNISLDSGVHVIDLSHRLSRFIPLPDLCDVYDITNLQDGDFWVDPKSKGV